MDVSLSTQNEKLVKEKMKSGEYGSPDEVLGAALRLLDERDKKLTALRADVQVGLDQLERGEYTEYDAQGLKELAERIKSRGRERLKAKRQQSA